MPQAQQPGPYLGTGRAALATNNSQHYLFQSQTVPTGTASIALQLERVSGAFYPFGGAFEVSFSADPGVFNMDIEAAEVDTDANYAVIGSISNANSGFVGRFDMVNLYPKNVRGRLTSLQNSVLTTLLLTR